MTVSTTQKSIIFSFFNFKFLIIIQKIDYPLLATYIFIYYDDFLNAEIIEQPRNYAMIHRWINSWESVVLLRTSVR